MDYTHIKGIDKGKIVLYALSTCVWCKRARQLLDELGVDYYYVYIDQLGSPYKTEATEEVKKWNPQCTFPTIVINDEKCITGYNEDKIRKEFK
jgi:glutaredoxin-like protein NrdH